MYGNVSTTQCECIIMSCNIFDPRIIGEDYNGISMIVVFTNYQGIRDQNVKSNELSYRGIIFFEYNVT